MGFEHIAIMLLLSIIAYLIFKVELWTSLEFGIKPIINLYIITKNAKEYINEYHSIEKESKLYFEMIDEVLN